MLKKLPSLLLHLVFLAVVCAIGAYWVLKIVTPPPSAPPPAVAAAAPREADPTLAARMFGLVRAAPVVASNIQVVGVFSAGEDSSAILAVDGKPGRVVLLGQAVSAGTKLVGVRPDGVTLDSNGARQELRLPLRAPIAMGGGGPPRPRGFTREGDTLSAPGAAEPSAPATGLRTPAAPAQDFSAGAPSGAFPAPGAPPRPMPQQQPPQPPQEAPDPSVPVGGRPVQAQ